MRFHSSARPAVRRTRPVVMTAVVVTLATAGIVAVLGRESLIGFSSTTSTRAKPGALDPAAPLTTTVLHERSDEHLPVRVPGSRGDVVDSADGKLPDGVTVFDERYPGVTRLDPALLGALRDAATDARSDGVTFYVNSGWRSRGYQEQLFAEAVAKYGSARVAARWVARPGTSVHEAGEAVDVGGAPADGWLAEHGAAYGLCRTYRNESWHFELRLSAIDHGCPAPYADPTHDPRMQQ
ncbi:M15 family metallopeptidase [Nocardioides sp. BP30]|uniref:M15 family metallopeptidase n=1 Tax=Nocardioides sp. BP30 TaxID=3036374 RepID=UPI0024692124|nr:M15 family metallopeptidase [Nocardioides sp. BP30]WGL50976.1 M15 family metallopeptidase [Nocardioides sp. BP30]